MINKYGFYLIIDNYNWFVFWRNLVNVILIVIVIILLYFLYIVLRNRKNEEKTITYLNLSTIIYKWNNRAIITFPDLSRFVGKLKNNLPNGKGVFKTNNFAPIRLKFNEGESSFVKIVKSENGYNYQLIQTNSPVLNIQFGSILKWLVFINSVLLLVAIAKMPYGFYIILRILTTLTCCLICYVAYNSKKIKTVIMSGLLVILYNPIIPIPLGRDIWIIVNLISLPMIILFLFSIKRNRSS